MITTSVDALVILSWKEFREILELLPEDTISEILQNKAGSRGSALSKETKIDRIYEEYKIRLPTGWKQ